MIRISLEYHDVVEAGAADRSGYRGKGPASYKLAWSHFEDHLRALSDSGVRERVRLVTDDPLPDSDLVHLSFDDGGISALRIADALEQHGWRGHFMAVSGAVGKSGFLAPHDLRELSHRGHLICTHSATHPLRMGALSYEQNLAEWSDSIARLSDILGSEVTVGSVPGGLYLPHVGKAASAAGLRYLFTSEPVSTVSKVGACLLLGRYTIRPWTTTSEVTSLAKGEGRFRAKQWLRFYGAKALRRVGGNTYLRLRDLYWRHRS